jgi:hypothetical protein
MVVFYSPIKRRCSANHPLPRQKLAKVGHRRFVLRKGSMNYTAYIASTAWAAKRKARLAIDGNRCRLCDEDGSRFQLEVHHRPNSYANIPNESVEDDLITVCSRCHNLITSVIREDRYGKQEHEPTLISNNVQARQEINHGMARDEIQVDIVRAVDNAQRANRGPDEQVVEIDKTDFFQATQDRRRL